MADNVHTLLEHISDGLLVLTPDGEVVFANRAALQHLGMPHRKVIGHKLDELTLMQRQGATITRQASPFYEVVQTRQMYQSDHNDPRHLTMARADRSLMNVYMTVLPFSPDGPADGITVLFHDQSSDEQVDKAKSEFVALVSHQLRTPVNIVSWYVEKMQNKRRGHLNPQQEAYLNEINLSTRRLIELVQGIVNVSRADLNRLKHKHEVVDAAKVVERSMREFAPQARLKKLRLTHHFDGRNFMLADSDREMLAVVIKSIVSNAVRYTQRGGKVDIRLNWVEANKIVDTETGWRTPSRGILVHVKDTGLGIPDDEKSRVFLRLFRGSNVRALDVAGIGLGLYLADRFAKELGGKVWFESVVRKGSAFHVFVPAS